MLALIGRDVRLAWRAGGGALTGLLFFLAVVALVPFALGPDLPLLERVGPAILWLGALLASLLGLDRLWTLDREDGSLDLLLMGRAALPAVALAKVAAHWIASLAPLALVSPLLGLLANQGAEASLRTLLTLLIGTPSLAALGALGAAVTVALPRGGLLTAVIVLPLSVPTLVFGVGAATGTATPFLLLGAVSLFTVVLSPVAIAAALRAELG